MRLSGFLAAIVCIAAWLRELEELARRTEAAVQALSRTPIGVR